MAFTMEHHYEIWTDESGECIEVGPDRDALGLIEVRLKEPDGQIVARIPMQKEQAQLVANALLDLALSQDKSQ